MRVSEALELFEQSAASFKSEIVRLRVKELYELVKDLRLVNKPEVFNTARNIFLKDKLLPLLEEVEGYEKTFTKEEGFLILHKVICEETGLNVDLETSPNTVLRKIINEITNWSQ